MPRPINGLSPGAPIAPSGDSSFPTTATTRRMLASRSTSPLPKDVMSASMPIWRKNTGMKR